MRQISNKKLQMPPVVRRDLKACPFCGASPEIEYWHGGGPHKRMIACSNTECDVGPSVTGENEGIAVGRWEKRA